MAITQKLPTLYDAVCTAALIVAALLVLEHWGDIRAEFTRERDVHRLASGQNAMSISSIAATVVHACAHRPPTTLAGSQLVTTSLSPDAEYSRVHRSRIDRGHFVLSFFDGQDEQERHSLVEMAECLAAGVMTELQSTTEGPSVLRTYFLIENARGEKALAVWPGMEIPDNYPLAQRPWTWDAVTRAGGHIEVSSQSCPPTCITVPYPDYFLHEEIVSLVGRQSFNDMTVLYAVDANLTGRSALQRVLILLTFGAVCVFILINVVARRALPSAITTSWHRAWLGWGVVYAVYVVEYIVGEPFWMANILATIGEPVRNVFSAVNNAFFVLTALLLIQHERDESRLELWSRRFFGITVVPSMVGMLLPSNDVLARVVGWVDGVCSCAVAVMLGYAMVKIMRERPWKKEETSSTRAWNAVGIGMIGTFFVGLGILQVTIPIWSEFPGISDAFWLISPTTKLLMFSIFYMVFIGARYWESFDSGTIAVDSDFKVLWASGGAVRVINRDRQTMIGRTIHEVLFRSLMQVEDIREILAKGESFFEPSVATKKYRVRNGPEFDETLRPIYASRVDSPRGVEYALFHLPSSKQGVQGTRGFSEVRARPSHPGASDARALA